MQNLCENGGLMMKGTQLDGTFRMHYGGLDVGRSSLIGAFCEFSVMPEWSCVKIPRHFPLLWLLSSAARCPTGWGSAVHAAQVRPGDVIIVMGVGGIGINAVQGAAHAGATA